MKTKRDMMRQTWHTYNYLVLLGILVLGSGVSCVFSYSLGSQSGFADGVLRGKDAALREVFQEYLASVTQPGWPIVSSAKPLEEGFALEQPYVLISNAVLVNFSDKCMFEIQHPTAHIVMHANYSITFVPGGRTETTIIPGSSGNAHQTVGY